MANYSVQSTHSNQINKWYRQSQKKFPITTDVLKRSEDSTKKPIDVLIRGMKIKGHIQDIRQKL